MIDPFAACDALEDLALALDCDELQIINEIAGKLVGETDALLLRRILGGEDNG
jgi:hypothetical protein